MADGKRLDPSDEVRECLRRLHPECEKQPDLSFDFQTISGIAKEEVRNIVVKKLSRGAAPGLDGWTRELLLPLVYDSEALSELTVMVDDLLNKNMSEATRNRLLGCPLFALEKSAAPLEVRPIAIESAIFKLISHIAISRLSEEAWNSAFCTNENVKQMGVGPQANLEKAVHASRSFIAEGYECIALDSTNAYNSLKREKIASTVKANKSLWPISKVSAYSLLQAYLCATDGKGVTKAVIVSKEGVRQGSVLGPLLFSLVVHPQLCRLAEEFPEIRIVAYLDDINIFVPPNMRREVAERAEGLLAEIGLKINSRKSHLLTNDARASIALGGNEVKGNSGVVKLLGAAAAATPETTEVRKFVDEKFDFARFFTRLEKCEASTFSKMRILQVCATGKPTFLIRTHPPETTEAAADRFDNQMIHCLATLVGEDCQTSRLVNLPMKMGGLGLRRVREVAPLAYGAREKGAQRAATAELDQLVEEEVMDACSAQQKAIVKSFSAVPIVDVGDEELKHHLRERLLLPTAPHGQICSCGEPSSMYHVHSCKKLSEERITRHDHLVRCLRRAAEQRYVVQEEHSVRHTRHRPDLKIYVAGVAAPMMVDMTVTFTGSTSGAGKSISHVEAEKRAKYKAVGLEVVPFVLGHTGELGPAAIETLERILPREERGQWIAELRRILLKGNLRVHRGAFFDEGVQ